MRNPFLFFEISAPSWTNFGLRGLLLPFQSGPPATKCHGHTPCAMFLAGTEPRCENLYSSLRSLRSPVQNSAFAASCWSLFNPGSLQLGQKPPRACHALFFYRPELFAD